MSFDSLSAGVQVRRLAVALLGVVMIGALMGPGLALAASPNPEPGPDTISTDEDVSTSGNVLTNDTDPNGLPLSVEDYDPVDPSIGDLTIAANGDYSFDPAPDWSGSTDTRYRVTNGAHRKFGDIHIVVAPANDAPTAVADTASVDEDTPTDLSSITANDTDPDGDSLSVSDVSGASGGTVELDAGVVTFSPTADLCGVGAGGFDYEVADGNGGTDSAHVSVDIDCLNDDPQAGDDSATGDEDDDLVMTDASLLTNDTDPEDDSLTVTDVSGATGGSVVLLAGTITFSPTADLCGPTAAGFDYAISDGNGGTASGHVAVALTCQNDAPTAVADTASVDGASGPADYDVIANDTDIDGDSLSLVDVSVDPSAGTVVIASGLVRFTPATSFEGDAIVSYEVSDGALSASGTLTVSVGPDTAPPVAAAPTVVFGSGRVNESAPLRITWSATDAGVGVASYEVQVSVAGGPWAAVYAGAATSISKFYPFNKTLVWRVRATDGEGNVSGWATSATRKIVAYQGGKPMTYTGTWTNVKSTGSSGIAYRFTKTLGKRASLTFSGQAVLYVAPKTRPSGYVKVYVDGKLIGRFKLYRSSTALGQIIARASWSANGTHVIRVVNDQAGRRANFDAFVVLR